MLCYQKRDGVPNELRRSHQSACKPTELTHTIIYFMYAFPIREEDSEITERNVKHFSRAIFFKQPFACQLRL